MHLEYGTNYSLPQQHSMSQLQLQQTYQPQVQQSNQFQLQVPLEQNIESKQHTISTNTLLPSTIQTNSPPITNIITKKKKKKFPVIENID